MSKSPFNKIHVALVIALIATIILASIVTWINLNQQNQIETLQTQESNLQNEIIQLQNQIEDQNEEKTPLETIINSQETFIEDLTDRFEINQNSANLKGEIVSLERFIHESINQIQITNLTKSGLGGYHALIVESKATVTIKNTGANTVEVLTVKVYTSSYSFTDDVEIESLDPGESIIVRRPFHFVLGTEPPLIIEIRWNGIIIECGSF